jgi:hypothetical protein
MATPPSHRVSYDGVAALQGFRSVRAYAWSCSQTSLRPYRSVNARTLRYLYRVCWEYYADSNNNYTTSPTCPRTRCKNGMFHRVSSCFISFEVFGARPSASNSQRLANPFKTSTRLYKALTFLSYISHRSPQLEILSVGQSAAWHIQPHSLYLPTTSSPASVSPLSSFSAYVQSLTRYMYIWSWAFLVMADRKSHGSA